jgi:hypothetical protein
VGCLCTTHIKIVSIDEVCKFADYAVFYNISDDIRVISQCCNLNSYSESIQLQNNALSTGYYLFNFVCQFLPAEFRMNYNVVWSLLLRSTYFCTVRKSYGEVHKYSTAKIEKYLSTEQMVLKNKFSHYFLQQQKITTKVIPFVLYSSTPQFSEYCNRFYLSWTVFFVHLKYLRLSWEKY